MRIEHHAPLGAHDESRLRKPTSKSTPTTFLPLLRQRRAHRGRRGGLAHPALA
jgi:hypothetical protein